jgi:hypothetical protein
MDTVYAIGVEKVREIRGASYTGHDDHILGITFEIGE